MRVRSYRNNHRFLDLASKALQAGQREAMACVQRLTALVTPDDPQPTLAAAEKRLADGDEGRERWVDEYRRGEAIIVRLAVTLEVSDGGGEVVETVNRPAARPSSRNAP